MPEIIVIAHNIRSTHNVGSIFRTCEGFGVEKLILSGYTPYPSVARIILANDGRLPYLREKLTRQIHKTALGAEEHVDFEFQEYPDINELKESGYQIVALEQAENSINISDFKSTQKIALILGEEVHGIENNLLAKCDKTIEIPMFGKKESFNVSVAAGIALYQLSI